MAAQVTPVHPLYPAGYPGAAVAGGVANLRLFVAGRPEPKGRARSRIVSGPKPWVQVYPDATTVAWEDNVGWQVREQLARLALDGDGGQITLPFRDRVIVALRYNFDRPKSAPKRVRFPTKKRTDIDNLEKAVLDALCKANVLADDCQVTDCLHYKRFSEDGHPQGVEIDLTAWQEP